MSLNGLSVESDQLEKAGVIYKKITEKSCEELGCTLEQVRSAKKLEAWLQNDLIYGMSECLERWPRTPSGQLLLKEDKLKEFIFQIRPSEDAGVWFAQYFKTKEAISDWVNVQKTLFPQLDLKLNILCYSLPIKFYIS